MLTLHDEDDLERVADPALRAYLAKRFAEVCEEADYDVETMVQFAIAEPGDTIASLERDAGCWLVHSPFGGPSFGEADYVPCFETLEQHASHFEVVWVMADGDGGLVLLVPDDAAIDPALRDFCVTFATPAP